MKTRALVFLGAMVVAAVASAAGAPATKAGVPLKYRNPIWADLPDMGLCSDGKRFYMISTTMHLCPGAPVMASDDMVHWKVVSYVFDKFPDAHPRYSLDGETAYGGGQWASSMRYHDGKFYVWFVMNGSGGYLYTADRAEGPWKLHSSPGFMHDGSLFFDDDGSAYVCHGDGWITALSDDLTARDKEKLDRNDIDRSDETALLEGTAMFKKDGWYYRMMVSAYMPGVLRREVCYRSRSLAGPWEKKVILETDFDGFGGVGQGCVVEKDGEWWALVFQDRGGVGRVPCLMPVVWTDGWPMLGSADGHSIPNDVSLPYADVSGFIDSDGFDKPEMSILWQWNHNPVAEGWSLTDRPGWLRLKPARVVKNLMMAPNTLTQRMCGPACMGEVTLDYSGLKDGDRAGIAAYQSTSATLGVENVGGRFFLVMRSEKPQFSDAEGKWRVKTVDIEEMERVELPGIAISQDKQNLKSNKQNGGTDDSVDSGKDSVNPVKSGTGVVHLRVKASFVHGTDWAAMEWSLDGKSWKEIGRRVKMVFDPGRFFMGAKFALYCYSTKATGGHADFDDFVFTPIGHEPKGAISQDLQNPGTNQQNLKSGRQGARGSDSVNPVADSVNPVKSRAVQFPLGAVRLGAGPMKERRDVDTEFLLEVVDPDRLLAVFREVAGLEKKAERYPNRWEGGQINGHSLGHYLSAVAALYAVAPDAETKAKAKERVDYVVGELAACQAANGNGFLMTCPQEIYDSVRRGDFTTGVFDINRWWVPNYTLHKIFAGLRDAYRYADSKEALEVETKLADWYVGIVQGLDGAQLRRLLVSEWGGLNETFADLADDTGKAKYRRAAETYFDDAAIFTPLKIGVDDLDGRHANTQVPKIAGLARLYEQTGKSEYRRAVATFWNAVARKRAFANGGHSDDEHFYPITENAKKLGPHNNETCNIFNMLRLTAHTFGWSPSAAQMDFVERALYNQLMAQIGRKPGEFGYFLSQAPVAEKVWSTPEGAWWCCVGTGMENPMHYTEHVYYRSPDDKALYVNLFAPTVLDWESRGVRIAQKTQFPKTGASALTVATKTPQAFAMKIRKPWWCRKMGVTVNGEAVAAKPGPDGYVTIARTWKNGDTVGLKLPMEVRAEFLPESDGTRVAFMYGPLVLAGITPAKPNEIDNAKLRWDDHLAAPGKTSDAEMVVVTTNIVADLKRFRKGKELDFTAAGLLQPADRPFMPLMDVYEEHYSVYFPVMKPRKWDKEKVAIAERHRKEAEEEARKIDEVFPGFQQSEVNHDVNHAFSGTGDAFGKKWRNSIGCWGLIEYTMKVDGAGDNELVITVNGGDGHQFYDILIDGELLQHVTREEPLKPGSLTDTVYAIPRSMTAGKDKVRVSVKGFDDQVVDGEKVPNTGSGWIGGFFYFGIRKPAPAGGSGVSPLEGRKSGGTPLPPVPPLHVAGRYLVDNNGYIRRYRGTMQSLSSFFSGGRWGGGEDEDAAKRCVAYMKELVDMMSESSQGSYCNMIRLTDDTYWCGKAGYTGSDRFERFDFARHRWYIDNVLVPIVEYAVSKGVYVIIRPSMNTEQDTHVDDRLQKHFVKEWQQFASTKRLQRLSGWVAFELENEPVNVRNANNEDDPEAIADYMQPMIDAIRKAGFKGVIWVPGAGYQSHFQGFTKKMVKDPMNNFGFAAHIYPGWYGQEDYRTTPETFLARILAQIPVVREHPVVVTECDWSPEAPGQGKFNEFGDWVPANMGSWGTATTKRWGKSLKAAAERLGNLSMMIGATDEVFDIDRYLRDAEVATPAKYNDECCGPYAMKWYAEWAAAEKSKPVKPAQFDKTRLTILPAQRKAPEKLKDLCTNYFTMTANGQRLQLPAEGDSSKFEFGETGGSGVSPLATGGSGVSPLAEGESKVTLFKAWPVKVDGKVYLRLNCYFQDGVQRLSHLEWGNGNAVYAGRALDALYLGACLPRSEHKIRYGQDADLDALWEAKRTDDGKWTFKNAATGRYLGVPPAACSETPVPWTLE